MQELDYTRIHRHWHDESDEHFIKESGHLSGKFSPLLPADRSAVVLEVGCGMGFALGALQHLGFTAIEGIDADRGQVALATRRGLPVTHVPVDAFPAFMAARHGRYDVVMAIDVLEHVPVSAQIDFLERIVSAMKPDGLFICQVPNANSGIASRYRYGCWTHHCSFTEHSLDFVLFNAGFERILVMETDRTWFPRLNRRFVGNLRHYVLVQAFRWLRRLEFVAALGNEGYRLPLTPNIIATARAPQLAAAAEDTPPSPAPG